MKASVVGPVTVTRQANGEDWEWVDLLPAQPDGSRPIVIYNVTEDLILSVRFVSETLPTVDEHPAEELRDTGSGCRQSGRAVEGALRG
jgi:hypothetical protein